jgi:hypothetical protein
MTNDLNTRNYLYLTEELNALDYLDKALHFASQVNNDPIYWKWIIISVHHATYGFAICALKGTAASLTVIEGNNKLISFPDAMNRCQNARYMNMLVTSNVLQLTEDQKDSIDRMSNDFRNHFMHFSPKAWTIELSGMAKIISDCLDVARFLALETGNHTHLDREARAQVERKIEKIKAILNGIQIR